MKRIIIIVILIFVLITIISTIIVGNYFVNFALVRKNGESVDVSPEPDKTIASDVIKEIEKNKKDENSLAKEWLDKNIAQTVNIKSNDGLKLVADKYYSETKSHKWVILVHGYGGQRKSMISYATHYSTQDYNILTPDLRGHGESEGKYIGMGWLDRNDILLWINYILKEDSEAQIVLHGVSMGGATVMMTSGEKLPKQVKAIIDDCGYTSVWDIFEDELGVLFNLPAFPALYMSNVVSKIRVGYSFKEASAIEQVQKSEIPILFIHGDKDTFVQTHMVYELYDAAKCEKDIMVVKDAGHAESKDQNPEKYFEKVFSFLENKVK